MKNKLFSRANKTLLIWLLAIWANILTIAYIKNWLAIGIVMSLAIIILWKLE